MAIEDASPALTDILEGAEADLVEAWFQLLKAQGVTAGGRIKDGELRTQCRDVLAALRKALSEEAAGDIHAPAFARVRDLLSGISRSRAVQGFSPSETATFIFSLKQPIFERLRRTEDVGVEALADESWRVTQLLDQLGLFTMEEYQKTREEVVMRQQVEISELSTPVVKLWDGILALPLIGTLDSARTQIVMENLLQSIVEQGAEIAIVDITGVPTVDTLVAQHLLKTIAATRLMGADCIISGIRPQIAQTMVHLGVELNVVSKASLADAFALALRQTGRSVVRLEASAAQAAEN